jgi:signal peptidase I
MSAIPDTDFRELFRWLFRLRNRFQVVGPSMIPLLRPGDQVLADPRAYDGGSPARGDVVVALHPYKNQRIIKRIGRVHAGDRYQLIGDNPEASTNFSEIDGERILGRVTSRLP